MPLALLRREVGSKFGDIDGFGSLDNATGLLAYFALNTDSLRTLSHSFAVFGPGVDCIACSVASRFREASIAEMSNQQHIKSLTLECHAKDAWGIIFQQTSEARMHTEVGL